MDKAEVEKWAHDWAHGLPGKRGIDIPEHDYDRIAGHATGAALPVWGRYPEPHHMQGFYEAGGHQDPEIIHGYYANQPHPHLEGMTVGQYHSWREAKKSWTEHTRG